MAKAKPAAAASPTLDRGSVPWLIAAALCCAAPHAAHLPPWLSLLGGALLVWRGWLWSGARALPPRWLLALLVIAGALAVARQFGTLFGRDAGVALLFLLMSAKPMEMRTRRDAQVVVMLGYFLLLTHFFYAQTIAVGVWLLTSATLLSAVLVRVHGGAQSPPTIVRLAATLSVQALPLAIALFVLFPRVSGPLWGLPQDAFAGVSGLSDSMAPGSLSSLIRSGAIAFRVRFAGTVPEQGQLYWRGPVFDAYDGKTWRALPQAARASSAKPLIEALGDPVSYETTLEAHQQRWLLALDVATRLPADAELGAAFEALARSPLTRRGRFAFTSSPHFVANRNESLALRQRALQLPQGFNPRTRKLAATWARDAPEQIVARALALFSGQAFFYTLQPPLLGVDAVDDFLFTARRGFCEHYAGAFVFLMRAAGLPARVVAGYQGGEVNPVDGYFTVRQSDAHAWAEVWIAGRGWQRVDPTAAVAPARVEQGIAAALPEGEPLPLFVRSDSSWLRAWRDRWEAGNNAWNQWVLGYTPERQRQALARLGLADADWRTLAALLAGVGSALLLALAALVLGRRPRIDPAQRDWLRFCRLLAHYGVVRADWEGPFAFAARVAREKPDVPGAPALAALTMTAARHYASSRYGSGEPSELAGLRECLRRVR